MWLSVVITDARGKRIFKSGSIDKNGNINEGSVIYYTHLGNEKGEPVLNVALADRIGYDRRIPPKGYQAEKYVFRYLDAVSPLTVEAVLKYLSASQSLAKELLGKNASKFPVIDRVSLVDKIEF